MTISREIITATFDSTVNVTEKTTNSLDPTLPNGQTGTVKSGRSYNFTGSGPVATKAFHGTVPLVAGALTLDLTALVDPTIADPIDMTGLKLKFLQVIADSGNANAITIAPGASNGYTGWVGADGLSLNASDQEMLVRNAGIAVDSTHKTLDLAGTGTQSATLVMLFG